MPKPSKPTPNGTTAVAEPKKPVAPTKTTATAGKRKVEEKVAAREVQYPNFECAIFCGDGSC